MSRESGEFTESSFLDTLIPQASDFNINDALADLHELDSKRSSLLPSIPRRRLLLFDELLTLYIVLRTPFIDDDTLKSYLARLAISVEATVASTQSNRPSAGHESGQQAQTKTTIYSGTIPDTEEPVAISRPDAENSEEQHIYVVWKVSFPLSRPRARIPNPAVFFTPSATLRPSERLKPKVVEDEFMPSLIPAGLNLLEPLQDDPTLVGVRLRLSALRVSRVAPATPVSRELLRPIKSIPHLKYRVLPALSARIRYIHLGIHPDQTDVLVTLDIEVPSFFNCDVGIERIEASLEQGLVTSMTSSETMKFPFNCQPKDEISLLYKLSLDDVPGNDIRQNPLIRPLDVSITATAKLSSTCLPRVVIRWQTPINFSALQTQSTPSTPAISQVANGETQSIPPSTMKATDNPSPDDSLPSVEATMGHQRDGSSGDFGVTITIQGPEKVFVGETFSWEILVVNRSVKPRKLALLVIPKRRRVDVRRHISKPSNSSTGGRKDHPIAEAIADENIVYTVQRNATMEPAEMVCLSTDIRIGPLAPAACHSTELKFMVLQPGVLNVEAVRLVDLASQDSTDLRDLPSVVAVHRDV